MKKSDAIGCLQLMGLLVICGIISYFFVKLIPPPQKSQSDLCRESGGNPLYQDVMRYRGFPPGAWTEKEFYKCD